MKKIILAILCVIALTATAIPAIAQDHDDYRGRHEYRGNHGYYGQPGYREFRGHENYGHRGYYGREGGRYEYRGRENYGHRGYFGREGHRYEYRGHYRNWRDWDRFARRHPEMFRHGHYYREGGRLMFRTCDPAGFNCFSFSIGR